MLYEVITLQRHPRPGSDLAHQGWPAAHPGQPRAGPLRQPAGHGLSPKQVKAKLDHGEDFVFLDVRTPEEHEAARIEDARVRLIPVSDLRGESYNFV